MDKAIYRWVNAITFYRLGMVPVMLLLVLLRQLEIVKWLFPVSYFSDLLDGYLARKFSVISRQGATLDSIADDLTSVVSLVALFVFETSFVFEHQLELFILSGLVILQMILSLVRFGCMTSFHTYLAKLATLLQGMFVILFLLLGQPLYPLFFTMVIVTAVDLVEEVLLVLLLPSWKTDVKGIFWQWKDIRKMKIVRQK